MRKQKRNAKPATPSTQSAASLEGDERRICQRDATPRDCAKSDNKARCEAEMAAHKACRGDAKTYRACFEGKTKK